LAVVRLQPAPITFSKKTEVSGKNTSRLFARLYTLLVAKHNNFSIDNNTKDLMKSDKTNSFRYYPAFTGMTFQVI
jgi:hypothetical protein